MLIGITGPAGAGKDTVADMLVERGFVKLAFAGPLKEMLAVIGMPEPADRALKEAQIEGFDFTWRRAIQTLGTEWGRGLDWDIWTKIVGCRIHNLLAAQEYVGATAHIVLSDVRFENEAMMIRQLGGCVVHLEGRKVDLGSAAGHVSEQGLRKEANDYVLPNYQTLVDLRIAVKNMLYGAGHPNA